MRRSWLIVLLVGVGVAAGLIWQRRVLQQRVEEQRSVVRQSEPAHDVGSLPVRAVGASQPASGNDEAVLAALRNEFEALKQRVGASAGSRKAGRREARQLSLVQGAIGVENWRDAGQDSPAASLESALWSAAGGDTARLAETLDIDPAYRSKASALLGMLPAEFHGRFATAEELVAFLMIRDVPLGSAEVLQQFESAGDTRLSVQLVDTVGRRKVVVLSFRQTGPTWRLAVPEEAIDRYTAFLQGQLR